VSNRLKKKTIILMLCMLILSLNITSAWYDESYNQRYVMNCSSITQNIPVLVNGSSLLSIEGDKQQIWTFCRGENTSVYYNDSITYIVANETSQISHEVAKGNGTSYNPTNVWSDYKQVIHFEDGSGNNILDSTGFNNCTMNKTDHWTTNGIIGGAYNYDGVDDVAHCGASSWLEGETQLTTINFIKPDNMPLASNYRISGRHKSGDKNFYLEILTTDQISHEIQGENGNILSEYSTSTISANNINFIGTVWSGGGSMDIYLNGSNQTTIISSALIPDSLKNIAEEEYLALGARWKTGTPDMFYDGIIDEYRVLLGTVSSGYMDEVYKNYLTTAGYGEVGTNESKIGSPALNPPNPPTHVSPTPLDNAVNNTQITINLTCDNSSQRLDLYFDTSNPPTTKVLDNSSTWTYTTSVGSDDDYYYKARCYYDGQYSTNTSVRTWTYDTESPTITGQSGRGFSGTNLLINYTLTDNNGLFAYEINVTRLNDTYNQYGESNESLSGTTLDLDKAIDASTWGIDKKYNLTIKVADTHTAQEIDYYAITKSTDYLQFTTMEENIIKITGEESIKNSYVKTTDRYTYNFEFESEVGKVKRKFVLESNNKIIYLPNSQYEAHFVIMGDDFGGNWIDFEGVIGDISISKISNYKYEIEIETEEEKLQFNSIGGLNTNELNEIFCYGNCNEAPTINLTFPTNGTTYLNTTAPYFNFSFTDSDNDTNNCELFINETGYGINNSLTNNTQYQIYANNTLINGNYYSYINCTDGINNAKSNIRTFNVTGLSCVPNWFNIGDTTCQINDTQYFVYNDTNNCNSSFGLPADNGTYVACNYCSESIRQVNTTCSVGELTSSYVDDNKATCCDITGLASDCSILYSPYNETSIVACTEQGLIRNFTCQVDPEPILHDKINVICEMPDNKSYCCVDNVYNERTGLDYLLSTSPEYQVTSTSILSFRSEQESRTCFTPVNRMVNTYYTTKNLRTDTEYLLEVYCTSNDGASLKTQYRITPTYDKPDWILNRLVWSKENMPTILITLGVIIILVVIVGFIIKKGKEGSL